MKFELLGTEGASADVREGFWVNQSNETGDFSPQRLAKAGYAMIWLPQLS